MQFDFKRSEVSIIDQNLTEIILNSIENWAVSHTIWAINNLTNLKKGMQWELKSILPQ